MPRPTPAPPRTRRGSRPAAPPISSPLLLLVVLTAYALLLVGCATPRPSEAHSTRAEHATPANAKAWHEVDTLTD